MLNRLLQVAFGIDGQSIIPSLTVYARRSEESGHKYAHDDDACYGSCKEDTRNHQGVILASLNRGRVMTPLSMAMARKPNPTVPVTVPGT